MSRRNARSKLCTTPSKQRHATEEDAVAAGRDQEAVGALLGRRHVPLYVYPCPCLMWHLTHHAYGRDGRRNRKVSE